MQHLASEQQIAFKQKQMLDQLERSGKVTPIEIAAPITGAVWGYRRRARLGAQHVPKKGRVLVGFREREASFLATLDSCPEIGRASWRERVCQYVEISVVCGNLKKKKY